MEVWYLEYWCNMQCFDVRGLFVFSHALLIICIMRK